MNNREIVDYILSNKLKEDEVIKEINKESREEYIYYLLNDGFEIYDIYGSKKNLLSFSDKYSKDSIFEIISSEQFKKEISIKEEKEEKERLLKQLEKINEKLAEYGIYE